MSVTRSVSQAGLLIAPRGVQALIDALAARGYQVRIFVGMAQRDELIIPLERAASCCRTARAHGSLLLP